MTRVRRPIGVGFGPGTVGLASPTDVLDYGRVADQLGFSHFWVNDHLSWTEPLLDPLVLLGSIAAVTERIELGTGVYLLPLRSPVATARAFASLDYLSGGRALLGVGVGGEFAEDFAAAGVPIRGRGIRTDQALRLIRQLWHDDKEVVWSDDFYTLQGTTVLPHPLRNPLPVIVGGRSDAALRRVARLGDGWMPYLMAPERLERSLGTLDGFLGAESRSRDDVRVIAHVFICFGDAVEQARESAIQYLSRQYKADMTRAVEKSVPHGPPEACAEMLMRYFDAGATEVVIRPLVTGDAQLDTLRGPATSTMVALQR